jgi:hypothetical protein
MENEKVDKDAQLDAAITRFVEAKAARGATPEEAIALARARLPEAVRATFRVAPKHPDDVDAV